MDHKAVRSIPVVKVFKQTNKLFFFRKQNLWNTLYCQIGFKTCDLFFGSLCSANVLKGSNVLKVIKKKTFVELHLTGGVMEPAFEAKQVEGQFAILQIDSEDKRAAAIPGSVRHFEKRVEEDLMMNDSAARSSSLESVAGHAKLQRRHSDGVQQYTRRNSLCLQLTTKLPKIPARRLLIDTTGGSESEDSLSRSHKTRQHDKNQGFPGSDLNTGPFQLKRKSLPQESSSSSGSRHAHGHRVLTRRRSAPWSSTSKQRESGINSCSEASSWQIKKHKRSLNIDDDDDSDNLEESWSRKSSSSSGFSSQSSLV